VAIRPRALEGLALSEFGNVFAGRRVLVTGHTGFKGSWLVLWLTRLGAKVSGLSLDPPSTPNHWDLLRLSIDERRVDIRDANAVRQAIGASAPEIVFHLAAQSLVRRSYAQPVETWATNVMGTVHVLDACRGAGGPRAVVVATTDKCYDNREWPWPYREIDALGGRDAYSASKAAAELVAGSYRAAFGARDGPAIATARAGNVIGGGDWAEDRLVPDLVRAMDGRAPLVVRSPRSVRPWQHVLDCLSGYLRLGQRLLDDPAGHAEAWNFGPGDADACTVAEVLSRMQSAWPDVAWTTVDDQTLPESATLRLDSSKARSRLQWRPVWSLDEAVTRTAGWYAGFLARKQLESSGQLDAYVKAARSARLAWTTD
jgi:CDP-glucose 4,6-dehydratase